MPTVLAGVDSSGAPGSSWWEVRGATGCLHVCPHKAPAHGIEVTHNVTVLFICDTLPWASHAYRPWRAEDPFLEHKLWHQSATARRIANVCAEWVAIAMVSECLKDKQAACHRLDGDVYEREARCATSWRRQVDKGGDRTQIARSALSDLARVSDRPVPKSSQST